MGLRIHFVKHPKTRRCASCAVRPDGKCEFDDGTVVEQDQLRSAFEFSPIESLLVLILLGCVVAVLTKWAFFSD